MVGVTTALLVYLVWLLRKYVTRRRLRHLARPASGLPRYQRFAAQVFPTWFSRHVAPTPAPFLPGVISELAAGQQPDAVWKRRQVATINGIPLPGPLERLLTADGSYTSGNCTHAAATIVLACRLSQRTGLSLAVVLEQAVAALNHSRDADSARHSAVAGAQATARLLFFLPLFGLLMGNALGADAVGWLLTTPLGYFSLFLATVCTVTGRWWVARLISAASHTPTSSRKQP